MSEAQRDAWLAEMWRPVKEVSREDRELARERAECAQPVDKPVRKRGKREAS